MIIEIASWLFERGGWPVLVGCLGFVAAYYKDKQLTAEHRARIHEARETAKMLHGLLSRNGKTTPVVSIPDEDETTGIIDIRNKLQTQAKDEL